MFSSCQKSKDEMMTLFSTPLAVQQKKIMHSNRNVPWGKPFKFFSNYWRECENCLVISSGCKQQKRWRTAELNKPGSRFELTSNIKIYCIQRWTVLIAGVYYYKYKWSWVDESLYFAYHSEHGFVGSCKKNSFLFNGLSPPMIPHLAGRGWTNFIWSRVGAKLKLIPF